MSVVIPTYNRSDLLTETLDSVLTQDWLDLEVVVVDDGSTDSTPELLGRYEVAYPGVFRIIRQQNGGVSHARNEGIREARHLYVALLDSDNLWITGKLRRQMDFHCRQELDLTFTSYYCFGDLPRYLVNHQWETLRPLDNLLVGCCINTSTVVAKRDVLLKCGAFDTTLRCCEDHDLWLRIAAGGHRIGYLPVPLTDYRVHGGGVSTNLRLVSESAERVYEKLFADGLLPPEYQSRQAFYLARCYLNTACSSLEAGDSRATRSALWRAARTWPWSIRPGWMWMYLRSVLVSDGR